MKRYPLPERKGKERKGVEDLSKASPSGAFGGVSLTLALPGA